MHNVISQYPEIDPCRAVSITSLKQVEPGILADAVGVRLVLRHHKSGREFPLIVMPDADGGLNVVSDYYVLEEAKGLRTECNHRGQLFWQKYEYPNGWVTARYMFPDEQDAYQAAVVMGADFSFLLSRVDPLPH